MSNARGTKRRAFIADRKSACNRLRRPPRPRRGNPLMPIERKPAFEVRLHRKRARTDEPRSIRRAAWPKETRCPCDTRRRSRASPLRAARPVPALLRTRPARVRGAATILRGGLLPNDGLDGRLDRSAGRLRPHETHQPHRAIFRGWRFCLHQPLAALRRARSNSGLRAGIG